MNKDRRKRLTDIYNRLQSNIETIEGLVSDERGSLENLPDNIRNGERADEMESYIDMMDEAIGYIEDAMSVIEQI